METDEFFIIKKTIDENNLRIDDFEFNETDLSNIKQNPHLTIGKIKVQYKPTGIEKTYATGDNTSAKPGVLLFPENLCQDIIDNAYKTRQRS